VTLGHDELERRQVVSGKPAVEVLAPREQVTVAQLLTSRPFLDISCNPLVDDRIRYRYVAKEFGRAAAQRFSFIGQGQETPSLSARPRRLVPLSAGRPGRGRSTFSR